MQGTEELLIDRARLADHLEKIGLAMLDGVLPRQARMGMSLMGLGDLDSKCGLAARRIAHELPADELYATLSLAAREIGAIKAPGWTSDSEDPASETTTGRVGRPQTPALSEARVVTRVAQRIAQIIRETFQQ